MRINPLLALTAALISAASGIAVVAQTRPSSPTTLLRPQYGTFGFDLAGMERSVSPGDNFYQYANGTWARNTAIPADKANYGMFSVLDDLSRDRTRAILEESRNDASSKIGSAYASYLDQAAIDSKGLAPIQPWLDSIRALQGKAGYAALVARGDRMSIGGPVSFYIAQDDKQPDVYAANLIQGGIGLPDREYYLSQDAKLAEIRAAYVAHLEKMLALAGESDVAARAEAIMAFETSIAKAHWTREESRDATKIYNKMTVRELAERAPGFDVRAYLDGVGVKVDSLIVSQPSAVTGIAAAVAAAPIGVLKDQLLVRSLEGFAEFLPAAIDRQVFAFRGTVLTGTPEQEDRWKRAVGFVTSAMGEELGKAYVARHFPPETKVAADTLVRNVTAAMGRRIDRLEWMTPETKAKARAKLAAFIPKIGYPDRWRDYSGLTIRRGDAFGNAVRARAFRHEYEIGKLGKEIYRWEWHMTPMTVNAYANFGMVEIAFPAAILQPPFFDPHADPALNYGGIGSVIGHEISHHFDDQGAKYDAGGRLSEWWTPQDVRQFEAMGQRLVGQYEQYEPLPGMKVNGKLTLGENIADLAGLTVAYDAYRASLGGKQPPVIDGFTGDQRFYLGWAQIWRRSYREANLRQRLLTDPHAPSEQRAAVVRNMDRWYEAFRAVPGQKLYLPPDQRVRIW